MSEFSDNKRYHRGYNNIDMESLLYTDDYCHMAYIVIKNDFLEDKVKITPVFKGNKIFLVEKPGFMVKPYGRYHKYIGFSFQKLPPKLREILKEDKIVNLEIMGDMEFPIELEFEE